MHDKTAEHLQARWEIYIVHSQYTWPHNANIIADIVENNWIEMLISKIIFNPFYFHINILHVDR